MAAKKNLIIVTTILFIAGCNGVLPPALAENQLEPAVERSLHELNFNVRPGVQAKVILSETRIIARINNGKSVRLSSVRLPLLREWGGLYLKVNDYDHDGMNDLAVLTTAGRGGKQRCYAIYRYDPRTGQFRDRKSFDRCNI